MTHTTPEQARKIAGNLDDHNSSLDRASRIALRSLVDQLEVVTADCEKFANQTFAARAEAKTLVDHANAERDAYKLGVLPLIEECRAALAEELAGWDIEPPLHHVQQAHDKCVTWLAQAIAKEIK